MSKIKNICLILFVITMGHEHLFAMGDPTRPPMSIQLKQVVQDDNKKIEIVKHQLTVIKIIGSRRIATIDDRQYAIGQAIGKSRVKSISLNQVVLDSGKTLSLFDKTQVHVANKGY